MSLAPPAVSDRRGAPLALNLSSNNPFRNRSRSPGTSSPAVASPSTNLAVPGARPARPLSTNPFLAPSEGGGTNSGSSNNTSMANGGASRTKNVLDEPIEIPSELFNNSDLKDRRRLEGSRYDGPKRSDTFPEGRRPSRSEEDRRALQGPATGRLSSKPRVLPDALDPFASPERRPTRPHRTNSESSSHGPLTEAEKKERDLRRRQRESRYRMGERDKDGKLRTKSRRTHGLDIIDKLDVTGIYGSGLFHHDGPFDACNPHRNRRKDQRAPMQAFPANSANNLIGGSGPVNNRIDLDRIRGAGPEGYSDFSTSGVAQQRPRKNSFDRMQEALDPYSKTEVVHGEETFGLGTSTFLEGTPASRQDIQRHNSDKRTATLGSVAKDKENTAANGGIVRKKSLAMRLRGMSSAKRPPDETLPINTNAGPASPDSPPRKGSIMTQTTNLATPRDMPSGSQSAGGRLGQSGIGDANPFFQDYDEAYEKKSAVIRAREVELRDGGVALPPAMQKPGGGGANWPLAEKARGSSSAGLERSAPKADWEELGRPPRIGGLAQRPSTSGGDGGGSGGRGLGVGPPANGGGGGGASGLLGRMKSLKVKKGKAPAVA